MGWSHDLVEFASRHSHFLTESDDHKRLMMLQAEEEQRIKERVAGAFDERRRRTGLKIVDFDENARWNQLSNRKLSLRGMPLDVKGWLPVFDPLDKLRLQWDLFVMIVLLVCIVVTPFQICFLRREPAPWGALSCFNLTMDVIFLVDASVLRRRRDVVASTRAYGASRRRGGMSLGPRRPPRPPSRRPRSRARRPPEPRHGRPRPLGSDARRGRPVP